ncbi:SH3 domain-containing protein [Streptomyces sp. BP-8]|uniref:SH3 domain-containing protein n=1 Tax=Streptomyces sirii TaxID=3127701 RepID=A0ABZ2QL99_9ACTN
MFRTVAAMAVSAVMATTLTLAGSANATAAPTAAPVAVKAVVCTVNDNGVNYRSGPGPQYPVMGTVNKGQKLNAHGQEGSWVMGDPWGGTTGVWIHVAYLDC